MAESYDDADGYAEDAWDDATDDVSVSRFRLWHLIVLLIIVILAAVLVVYGVMPFVASLMPSSAASDLLPNAIQA